MNTENTTPEDDGSNFVAKVIDVSPRKVGRGVKTLFSKIPVRVTTVSAVKSPEERAAAKEAKQEAKAARKAEKLAEEAAKLAEELAEVQQESVTDETPTPTVNDSARKARVDKSKATASVS